ncbi:MAG: hypothetical protein WKF90_11095 [Pyrinomonadaceae bacterium]
MKRLFLFLSLIFCLSFPAFAQQRPLLTEDVDITPEGSFEIGVGVDFLQNAKFPLSGLRGDQTRVGDVRVKVGFSSNVEFQIEGVLQNFLAVNSVTAPSPIPLNITGNSTNDVGDFTISTKIKLRNETENLPAIGFKVGLELPNTNQTRGIGINQTNVFGKVLVQKRFGRRNGKDTRLNVFGNLGIGILTVPLENFSQNDVLLYGLATIYRLNDRVNIVSEVNGRANTRRGNAPLGTESLSQFRIGTQIKASNLRFDSAAIFGLTRFSPRTGVTFGITYLSPNIFTPAK